MSDLPLDSRESSSVYGKPSFSVLNRGRRAVWSIVWGLLASWTPAPFHPWRRFLLRVFGASIAKTARIYGSARIWYPPNLVMEDYSVIGRSVICYCQDKITLREFANVAQGSHLCAGSHDIDDPNFQLITEPILLERYAWVAAEGFVGPGVTLGAGAVLGGRGVTFKNLEPWTVYIGNPAMPLRKRQMVGAEVMQERPSDNG